ncbi:MAG: SDR family oxidoreductase [Chloroflexota bacterium]
MDLSGRVAIVTGGSRGVGRGISLALARAGARVAMNYRKDEASARQTVADIQALGSQALALPADNTNPAQVREMVSRVLDTFGKVDILVNNAGIASKGNWVIDTEFREIERVVGTHAYGAFHFTQAVLPSMRQQPRGDIHFISSRGALDCPPRYLPYAMAKLAMEALALVLAKEELQHNIRVNIIRLGLVETDMGRRLVKGTVGADIEDISADMPFGRVCQPEDVGNLCAFLCSQKGEYLSGHIIHLDGGGSVRELVRRD